MAKSRKRLFEWQRWMDHPMMIEAVNAVKLAGPADIDGETGTLSLRYRQTRKQSIKRRAATQNASRRAS